MIASTITVAMMFAGPDESLTALVERGIHEASAVQIANGQLTVAFDTPATDFDAALDWAQDRIDVGLAEELGCEWIGHGRFY